MTEEHPAQERIPQGGLLRRIERITHFKEPFRFEREKEIKEMMLEVIAQDASDVYIQPDLPVCVLVQGEVVALTDRRLDHAEINTFISIFARRQAAVTDIISGKPVNTRYEISDPTKLNERGDRVKYGFRVNASPIQYLSGSSAQIVLRLIPTDPPHFSKLGLDEDVVKMMAPRDGCVYIAGRTGSGKTTTFSAVIRYLLENETMIRGNLITHEEPIEFMFGNILSKHSIIVQSQIPIHFASFEDANREAMRRKPGLIMIGEMRDRSTITAAVEASLTGHPVYGTVHANDVATVFRRLISRYPENERSTAIFDIIETARFVMAQQLVRGINGRLLAAREYLAVNEDMRRQLGDLSDMGRVTNAVSEMLEIHGHSFKKEAERLLNAGLIDERTAKRISHAG